MAHYENMEEEGSCESVVRRAWAHLFRMSNSQTCDMSGWEKEKEVAGVAEAGFLWTAPL